MPIASNQITSHGRGWQDGRARAMEHANITMISLSKLIESDDNVRPLKRSAGGLAKFAPKNHDLLQSIVVHETASGQIAVTAGACH